MRASQRDFISSPAVYLAPHVPRPRSLLLLDTLLILFCFVFSSSLAIYHPASLRPLLSIFLLLLLLLPPSMKGRAKDESRAAAM